MFLTFSIYATLPTHQNFRAVIRDNDLSGLEIIKLIISFEVTSFETRSQHRILLLR
jgi:hypothetical protein